MRLRRLNNTGIDHFNQFRASFPESGDPVELAVLLQDSAYSSDAGVDIEVDPMQFPSRLAAGEYLYGLFETWATPGLDTDLGMWTWLSAFYFEQLCPPNLRLGEDARWVPAVGDFQKYYRHLLAGPYQIYRAHRDNPKRALAVLATPPHTPGDIVEQLASRQELVTNPAVMEVATTLYINPVTELPKRGSAARENGGARRLADVLNQLDLTWDLYALTSEQLMALLPAEFDRFRS